MYIGFQQLSKMEGVATKSRPLAPLINLCMQEILYQLHNREAGGRFSRGSRGGATQFNKLPEPKTKTTRAT